MFQILLICLSLFMQEPKHEEITEVSLISEAPAVERNISEDSQYKDRIKQAVNFVYDLNKRINEEKLIAFTGDSRFVGMKNFVDTENPFFSKVGMGYNYFLEQVDGINASNPDVIIVGFGINDLYNADYYIEFLNSKPFSSDVIFLTVNPVNEEIENEYGYTIKNSDIDKFNEKIKENAINYTVLDTNNYLKEIGFHTVDGLHYTGDTYREIYDYIMKNI